MKSKTALIFIISSVFLAVFVFYKSDFFNDANLGGGSVTTEGSRKAFALRSDSVMPANPTGVAKSEATFYGDVGPPANSDKLPGIRFAPGGALVESGLVIRDEPIGAEGLGEIISMPDMEDGKRAECLARITLNSREQTEVRQEALDQWLKLLPEESEALLVALAHDGRLSSAMGAILLKDAMTRGESIQAQVACALLNRNDTELRKLAVEQLVLITGKDHGENVAAWSEELRLLLRASRARP